MSAAPTLERPLPQNLDAERSILGAILLDNHALNAAIENLKPEDFFLEQHRRVFNQMIALGESQQAIDLVTLTESLHRVGELESSGGAPYLAALADGMPRVSNIEHYARIVREKAPLRNLIHATHNIQQRALEGEDGADTILDNAESAIFALAEDRVKAGLIPIKDIVRDNFERLERIFREGKSITGIATGYTELDKLLSGLQNSELLILAARPSQGKTALALNLAENIAIRGGRPVAVFSLEMSKESLLQRLVASVAQVDAHKFRSGHLNREDWRRMTEGPRKRTANSRPRAQPVDARARTRRARPATFRLARIGRHRTGRRRRHVHLPPELGQDGSLAGRARSGRNRHRQAAQRPHRQSEIRLSQQAHALRRSRARRLLPIRPGRYVAIDARAARVPRRLETNAVHLQRLAARSAHYEEISSIHRPSPCPRVF